MMERSTFRSSSSLRPERREPVAAAPSRKARLAIVSTSSQLCGIAAYTAALQRQLCDAFDITVFDLNQYLLRNPHRRVRKLADRHIREICRAIRAFDGAAFAKSLLTLNVKAAARLQAEFRRAHRLSYGVARQLQHLQRYKQV